MREFDIIETFLTRRKYSETERDFANTQSTCRSFGAQEFPRIGRWLSKSMWKEAGESEDLALVKKQETGMSAPLTQLRQQLRVSAWKKIILALGRILTVPRLASNSIRNSYNRSHSGMKNRLITAQAARSCVSAAKHCQPKKDWSTRSLVRFFFFPRKEWNKKSKSVKDKGHRALPVTHVTLSQ